MSDKDNSDKPADMPGYDDNGNPLVQGVVTASIKPIKAEELKNLDKVMDQNGPEARAIRKAITGNEEIQKLHETRFIERTITADGKLDPSEPIRVRAETLDHAGKVARDILGNMHLLPIEPNAANAIAVAAALRHYETLQASAVAETEEILRDADADFSAAIKDIRRTLSALALEVPEDVHKYVVKSVQRLISLVEGDEKPPEQTGHPSTVPEHYRNPSGK